jgi:hypothetical protein
MDISTATPARRRPSRSLSDTPELGVPRSKSRRCDAESGTANRVASRPEDVSERSDGGGRAAGQRGIRGSRLVGIVYLTLVVVAGVAGALVAVFVDGLRAPRFLFLVPFPPTGLGFAAYGALTIAVVLGIPLALVAFVSRNVDDEGV